MTISSKPLTVKIENYLAIRIIYSKVRQINLIFPKLDESAIEIGDCVSGQ